MCVVRKTGPDLSVRVVSPRDEQVKNIRFEFERTWTIVGSFFDPSLNSSNVTVGGNHKNIHQFLFCLDVPATHFRAQARNSERFLMNARWWS
jgi:hypothetical protein